MVDETSETDLRAAAEWRDIDEASEGAQIDEYDLTTSPNDFNISTIYSFIQSGAVLIPGFQRNYVWDIKRASRLIESLIIGLPVPQVFLYEEDRNRFLVIDGQQRLMTIYYFMAGRFPRREKRSEIREIFNQSGTIPEEILHDDAYFEQFNLSLSEVMPGVRNKFNKLNYKTLGEYKIQFELRTIRNMIVKQVRPSDDASSVYEMFNRLNTGGVNLTPQEIRSSLYHSPFYDALFKWNMDGRWRKLIGQETTDLHMRDIEILLRAFAMASEVHSYTPSMVRFLNKFSNSARQATPGDIDKYGQQLDWFLGEIKDVSRNAWLSRQQKFQVNLFESVFAAAVQANESGRHVELSSEVVAAIRDSKDFLRYSQERTTDTANVKGRFRAARAKLVR
ncbi:DUF262 domain-containing protein [Nocardia xishanensis]|uniref:DUF262 domain-containing protein n=1 Tax=Nocardia xishanensis TaxID=238964 RepID=UPI0034258CB2